MTRRFLDQASSVLAWLSVGLGLLGMILGAVIFWAYFVSARVLREELVLGVRGSPLRPTDPRRRA